MPEHEETTDYVLINNQYGIGLLKYKGAFCHTVYESSLTQLFYNDKCNAVYMKEDGKVYELTINQWTQMVLKLETILLYGEEKSYTPGSYTPDPEEGLPGWI